MATATSSRRQITSVSNPAPTPTTYYDDLVITASQAAAVVLVTKIVAVATLAWFYDAPLSVDYWLGFVPYFSFAADVDTFTAIVTFSTLAMAVAASAVAVWTSRRPADHGYQRVLGRGVAAVIALQTLALEAYRHWRGPDTIQWRYAWLTVVAGLAGITVLALCMWNDRATAAPPKGTT